MGVVHQVYHLDEAVIVGVGRRDASLLIECEHALEEVNELASIESFGHQLAAFKLRRHVDLNRRSTYAKVRVQTVRVRTVESLGHQLTALKLRRHVDLDRQQTVRTLKYEYKQ